MPDQKPTASPFTVQNFFLFFTIVIGVLLIFQVVPSFYVPKCIQGYIEVPQINKEILCQSPTDPNTLLSPEKKPFFDSSMILIPLVAWIVLGIYLMIGLLNARSLQVKGRIINPIKEQKELIATMRFEMGLQDPKIIHGWGEPLVGKSSRNPYTYFWLCEFFRAGKKERGIIYTTDSTPTPIFYGVYDPYFYPSPYDHTPRLAPKLIPEGIMMGHSKKGRGTDTIMFEKVPQHEIEPQEEEKQEFSDQMNGNDEEEE